MAQSGTNYFLNNFASFNYEEYWKIWFDFKSTNPTTVSRSGASTLYTGSYGGVLPLLYDYRQISKIGGAATFVEITPRTGLWDDQMSLVFLNQKLDSRSSILFNCLETGLMNGENVYKGFLLGYTDASKPYFYFYGQNGPETYVADFSVGKNHALYFSRDNDNVKLGYYDYLKQENVNNSFTIDSDFLFEPQSGYFLGWRTGNYFPKHLWTSNGAVNLIDEFMWFNYPLYDYDIQMIASGWAANFTPQTTGVNYITTTGITGFSTGVTYATGYTGWGITGTGFLTNQYGISYTGYLSGLLTGTYAISGVVPLTGLIQTPSYFTIPASINVNTGFLRSFYKDYVTFLRATDPLDINEIFLETGNVGWLGYKENGVYDNIQEKFKVFRQEPLVTWLNGVANFSGNRTNSGSIYNPIYVLDRDYFRTGAYLESNKFYETTDSLYYRDISGIVYYQKNIVAQDGIAYTLPTAPNYPPNMMVFLNGQKMISGIDFGATNGDIEFGYTYGVTGDLCVISLYGNYTSQTGNFAWTGTRTGFNPNYTMLFMNGQRMIQNDDYIASESTQMLSGSGIFSVNDNIIFDTFNYNDPFFN